MNCEACLTQLDSWLDGELDDGTRARVQDHLAICSSCRTLFDAERRSWKHVSESLRKIETPRGLIETTTQRLVPSSNSVSRWARLALVPAAAAAIFVLVTQFTGKSDEPFVPPTKPGAVNAHTVAHHGRAVEFAMNYELSLEARAEKMRVNVLDLEELKLHVPDYRELEGAELEAFCKEHFGERSQFPREFFQTPTRAAAFQVNFDGTPVSNLLLDMQDRQISVFKLRRDHAILKDMKLLDDGTTTGIRIERCKSCHVIAVTRGNDVFILVSDDGIDPMLALVRQTF